MAHEELRSAFLHELKLARPIFYNTVIAQAKTIHVDPARVVIEFGPGANADIFRSMTPQYTDWIKAVAEKVIGLGPHHVTFICPWESH